MACFIYITLNTAECQGMYVSEDEPCMLQFTFAYGIANVVDTPVQLQRILNTIHTFCINYGMKVNLDQTNILWFVEVAVLNIMTNCIMIVSKLRLYLILQVFGSDLLQLCLSWFKAKCSLAR
jgi:hypothetical protein